MVDGTAEDEAIGVILDALARLASLPYHERYVRDATVDEYVLPDDLVLDPLREIEVGERTGTIGKLDPARRAALDAVESAIGHRIAAALVNGADWPRERHVDHVMHSVTWNALRVEAASALHAFGFDTPGLDEQTGEPTRRPLPRPARPAVSSSSPAWARRSGGAARSRS